MKLNPLRLFNLVMVLGIVGLLLAERFANGDVAVLAITDRYTWVLGAGLLVGVVVQRLLKKD